MDSSVVLEAKQGIGSINEAKETSTQMLKFDGVGNYDAALRYATQFLSICPHTSTGCIVKARSLCQLREYEKAKIFLEEILSTTHSSVLSLHAHSNAIFPPPCIDELKLKTTTTNNGILKLQCNSMAIVDALLCLGSDLARVYITCLKNSNLYHICCSDIIEATQVVITRLNYATLNMKSATLNMGVTPANNIWSWVETEIVRISNFLERKRIADKCFKSNEFTKAISGYSETIKVCL